MNKNAHLRFVFEPDDYPEIDLEFTCDEDMDFKTLLSYFRSFAIAMTYPSETIDKYLGEED